jgi:hypothetical protein
MIKLKEIAFPNQINQKYTRGYSPLIGPVDSGKYVLVYKQENTLVKGTRPYDTWKEAKQLLDLINDSGIVIKKIE